jgi:hypothetical protein
MRFDGEFAVGRECDFDGLFHDRELVVDTGEAGCEYTAMEHGFPSNGLGSRRS